MTSTTRPYATPRPWTSFELERWQSDWEHEVEINLADSGVDPVRLGELLDGTLSEELLAHSIHYPEVNGTARLRERIAALYPGASAQQVLVTVGAAEANSIIRLDPGAAGGSRGRRCTRLSAGPRARAISGRMRTTSRSVRRTTGGPTWNALSTVAGPGTAVISVNSPNNPTGVVLSEEELTTIVGVADRCGAWLHADEVYRGSELDGPTGPTAGAAASGSWWSAACRRRTG